MTVIAERIAHYALSGIWIGVYLVFTVRYDINQRHM